jgi:hypothetical protein
MDCCDSLLLALWAFCFAEDTNLFHQNLIDNFLIIVNLHAVLVCYVRIGLALPLISNFIPVGYKWYVKEHVVFEYCCAWRGFKDCMIGRANGLCCVVKQDIHVIVGYRLGHIEFRGAQHLC